MKYLIFLFFSLFSLSQISLAQSCTANFTFQDDGLNVQFTDLSTSDAGDPIVSWAWDFEDGTSNQQNPFHTFEDTDEFDVCLTITTQSGCSATLCIELQICTLNMTSDIDPNCNADGMIEVGLFITDPLDEAIEVDILLDGTPIAGGPFDIDDDAPVSVIVLVPGDGLPHTITAQSTEVGHCNATLELTTQDCNSNCFLSSMQVSITNTSMHNVQVGGNFFSPQSINVFAGDIVSFNWIDGGHSTTSDATTGPDSWNSGVQGSGYQYDVQITNPGTHQYYCIPHGGPGGSGMSGVIIANCPSGGNFDIEINFQTTIADPQGFNLLFDGNIQPGSPFDYTGTGPNTLQYSIAGDGQVHEIQIADVADPTCIITNNFAAPDCGAAPACSISVTAEQTGPCQAGNNIPYTLTLQTINVGTTGFQVIVDGNPLAGTFNYDVSGTTTVTVDLPGDGQVHTVSARDNSDQTCIGSTEVSVPDCNVPCVLSNLFATTGSSNIHIVEVQDFQFVPASISITSGDIVEFQWVGDVDHTSTSDATSGPDSWDSGLLSNGSVFQIPALSEGVHPYYCIPHGAPGGVGMSGSVTVQADCTNGQVAVTLEFTAEGEGFNGFNVYVDGNLTADSPFAYSGNGSNAAIVSAPGDGLIHQFFVSDVDNPDCSITAQLTTPDCNASTCQLSLSLSENGGCDDSGLVPVSLQIQDIGGGNAGFEVIADGNIEGTFAYSGNGTTEITINLPGDGQVHNVTINDLSDPECTATAMITTTDCSTPCAITDLIASFGSSSTQIVLVEDFEFVPEVLTINSGDIVEFQWVGDVEHTTTSDATSGPDTWDSGLLGNGATFQTPLLSAGVHDYYCIPHGGPGGVGMSGTIQVSENCENGMVYLNLSFSIVSGGPGGYYVFLDGDTIAGPLQYVSGDQQSTQISIPGDGMTHNIAIQDAFNENCSASIDYLAPECEMEECMISATAMSLGCNAEDLSLHRLIIEHTATGSQGLDLLIDGIPHGQNPFSYDVTGTTTIEFALPGDGNAHEIFLFDKEFVSCSETISIISEDCTVDCIIDNFSLEVVQGRKHIVEVQDFEFSPRDLTISVGDTVLFIWTGEVAHTTTSDASSGPDSWDSGLLSQGAEFELILNETGNHLYYCIPHGGPGGIGMAGTISVNEPCEGGLFTGRICFSPSNAGPLGFNVYVDGELATPNPLPYSSTSLTCFETTLPGDGETHELSIVDATQVECRLDTAIVLPDCDDPCFGFGSGFTNSIDHLSLEVSFLPTLAENGLTTLWDFGDGDTSTLFAPVHQYDQTGNYQVCLSVVNEEECSNTYCEDISVGIFECTALFDYDSDGLELSFTDISTSTIPADSWMWDFGDGSPPDNEQHPIHQYAELGVYEVCLTINADTTCASTYCKSLDLTSICLLANAGFEVDDLGEGNFNFQNLSEGNISSYLWGFGDGNISHEENPVHQFQSSGLYTVCLLILDETNSCSDYYCEEIEVVVTGTENIPGITRQILAYPNPVSGTLQSFRLFGWKEADIGRNAEIKLYNMRGEVVLSWEKQVADKMHLRSANTLPPGSYLLQISTLESNYIGKLIVH